jgi:two-component system, sensor histidine kinase
VAAARYVRLGGIVMALAALVAIVRHTLRTREVSGWILLAAATVAAGFGVRDWVTALDPANMGAVEWVPYVALIFALLMGWMMVDRFVKTLNEYERLNLELEARVAEKSRALEVELHGQAQARREAESANLAKSRFLAAASHDLRQPLHALGLFAEALGHRTHDPESQGLVLRINQSVAALESLFNEVLDVSKLDAGAVAASPRAIALQPVFLRVAADFVPQALEKGLSLRVAPTAAIAVSDPVLLERILRNLVANAIRYTEAGGVVLGVRRRGPRLAIEVRDSGIGIEKAEQARVFEEFYQVGNLERDRRRGLGLGLAIVKRLCDLLGHAIELESAPRRGTRFRILVERAATAAPVMPTPAAPPTPMQGVRVLVLDDEAEVRDSTATLLATWGCRVDTAATVEEALERLRRAAPALLIVDYRLREGTNGLDAARALRAAAGREIPVIVVSGESSAGELARLKDSGLALLHKPVPPAKLRGLMAHLLSALS